MIPTGRIGLADRGIVGRGIARLGAAGPPVPQRYAGGVAAVRAAGQLSRGGAAARLDVVVIGSGAGPPPPSADRHSSS